MPPSHWAKAHNVPSWQLAAVMVKTRWAREPARTVTELEFAGALDEVSAITVSGRNKADETKKGAS